MALTSDVAALVRAIRARPDEDTPRLVLADALDEAGEPDRAELVRVQVELAAIPPTRAFAGCSREIELRRRAGALTAAHPEWRPECPVCYGTGLHPEAPEAMPPCPHCNRQKRIGHFERGLLTVPVPNLAALFERSNSPCEACRYTGFVNCAACRGAGWVESKWHLTPYARRLRAEFPFVVEVPVADRVPMEEPIGCGKWAFVFGTHEHPSVIPLFLWQAVHGNRDESGPLPSPEAANRALANAVARALYDGATDAAVG